MSAASSVVSASSPSPSSEISNLKSEIPDPPPQSAIGNRQSEISNKKLSANRANAQKSTGPKTEQGKQRSSQNAATHGLYCKHLLLPGEDLSLFNDLRQRYLVELHPHSMLELFLVDRIVASIWKLIRLQGAESNLYITEQDDLDDDLQALAHKLRHLNPHGPRAAIPPIPPDPAAMLAQRLADPDDHALERLHRHEQRLERTIHRSLTELRKHQKSRQSDEDDPAADFNFLTLTLPSDDPDFQQFPQDQNEPTDDQNNQIEPTEEPLDNYAPENSENEPTASSTAHCPPPTAHSDQNKPTTSLTADCPPPTAHSDQIKPTASPSSFIPPPSSFDSSPVTNEANP